MFSNKNKAPKKARPKKAPKEKKKAPNKKARGRGGTKRGGGKGKTFASQYPLLVALDLNVIVPAIVRDELKSYAAENDGAVRRVGQGYTVVIVEHEALEKSGISETDDFGQLSMSLRHDAISSATREGDARQGHLVIIPNSDSLIAMDELDAFRDIEMRWGIFDPNIEVDGQSVIDEQGVGKSILCDGRTNLTELLAISADGQETIDIYGGASADDTSVDDSNETHQPYDEPTSVQPEEVTEQYVDTIEEIPSDNDFEQQYPQDDFAPQSFDEPTFNPNEQFETQAFDGVDNQFEQPTFDGASEFEQPVQNDFVEPQSFDAPTFEMEPEIDNPYALDTDTDPMFGGGESLFGGADPVSEQATAVQGSEDELRKVVTADEYIASVNLLESHVIDDTDLKLEIDTKLFNDLFLKAQPFRFGLADESLDTLDSTLSRSLNEKRRDYNGTIAKQHEENMQILSQMYMAQMTDMVGRVQKVLNDGDVNTESGVMRKIIEETRKQGEMSIDEMVGNFQDDLDREYEQLKQQHVQAVVEQAKREFDDKYKLTYDRKKDGIRAELMAEIVSIYNNDVVALTAKRQKMAEQAIAKMQMVVIGNIQSIYESMIADEENVRNEMIEDLNAFIEANFSDETLRAEALAMRLAQTTEAEKVRNEYEERVKRQNDLIESLRVKSNTSLQQAEFEYNNLVARLKKDHATVIQSMKEDVARKESDVEALREEIARLHDEKLEIGDRKEQEVKAQYESMIQQANNTIESQQQLLDSVDKEKEKASKKGLMSMIVVGLTTLAIGSTATFAYTASQNDTPPVVTVAQPAQSDTTAESAPVTETAPVDAERLEAYVAKSTDGSGALIIGYQETYKKGDSVEVVGSMAQSSADDMAKVIAVKDNKVTVQTSDKKKYSFIASN